jgi:hypothetical protein
MIRDDYPPELPIVALRALREYYANRAEKKLEGQELEAKLARVLRCQFPGFDVSDYVEKEKQP